LSRQEDAEDVYQETILAVWKEHKRFDPGRPFNPWLYRVACWKLNDFLRTHYQDQDKNKALEAFQDSTKEFAFDYECIEWMEKRMNREEQQIVKLRIEGKTIQQIADILTVNENYVKHKLSILRWTRLFRRAYTRYRRQTFDPNGVRPVEVLMGPAVLLSREAYDEVGGWDERYRFGVEDIDLSAMVNQRREVVYAGDVEIVHHGRASSRTNVGFAAPSVVTGYVQFFRKSGSGRWSLFWYKLAVTLRLVPCDGTRCDRCRDIRDCPNTQPPFFPSFHDTRVQFDPTVYSQTSSRSRVEVGIILQCTNSCLNSVQRATAIL
jgi:RNA polymerase sigma factor (sigma-70 family)